MGNNREIATKYLKQIYGDKAEFRDGQFEAIDSVIENKRSLVVQKTGWGKSLVYFLATKILRERGKGVSIVISPLLALMKNQVESAEKLGLKAVTINSSNVCNWNEIINQIKNNQCDLLLVSPERLGNEDFINNVLYKITKNIGMFVVDEAHCISDWGHDFRPDYRRISRIVSLLPMNVPILATTATANDRVIDDIKKQMGENIDIIRGELIRENIIIQVIKLRTKEERLAWIYENIDELSGSGIIYCLTQGDCELVAKWLKGKGVSAAAYYSGVKNENGDDISDELEEKFMKNDIRILVATVKLGMGYDKSDISFVIHFQTPGNLVAYYQQIGRSGRNGKKSYAILLSGGEDKNIIEYFINSAFPKEKEVEEILSVLESSDGMTIPSITKNINMRKSRIENALKYMEIEGGVYKDGKKYHKSANTWQFNKTHSEEITKIRKYELNVIETYLKTDKCYMEFISKELDDKNAKLCKVCANCLGRKIFEESISKETLIEANTFLRGEYSKIQPKKQCPTGETIDGKGKIPEELRLEEGIVLSNYGDAGYGTIVGNDKYKHGVFSDELVKASKNILKSKISSWGIDYITWIPSLRRPNLVKDFAIKLAKELSIPSLEIVIKEVDTPEQKELENSVYQFRNAMKGFKVLQNLRGNILLVDDMVDSNWTFTVVGVTMKLNGADKVYPYALSKTTGK